MQNIWLIMCSSDELTVSTPGSLYASTAIFHTQWNIKWQWHQQSSSTGPTILFNSITWTVIGRGSGGQRAITEAISCFHGDCKICFLCKRHTICDVDSGHKMLIQGWWHDSWYWESCGTVGGDKCKQALSYLTPFSQLVHWESVLAMSF